MRPALGSRNIMSLRSNIEILHILRCDNVGLNRHLNPTLQSTVCSLYDVCILNLICNLHFITTGYLESRIVIRYQLSEILSCKKDSKHQANFCSHQPVACQKFPQIVFRLLRWLKKLNNENLVYESSQKGQITTVFSVSFEPMTTLSKIFSRCQFNPCKCLIPQIFMFEGHPTEIFVK